MLAKLAGDAQLASVGIDDGPEDPFAEHYARPLDEHLEDFARTLRAKNDTAHYIDQTLFRIRAVLAGCNLTTLEQLAHADEDMVAEFLATLRESPEIPELPELPPDSKGHTKAELLAAVPGLHPDTVPRILRRLGLEANARGKARRYPRVAVLALQAQACRGMSVATSNGYVTSIKQFTRWLSKGKRRRIPLDPLSGLARLNGKADRRVRRRALSPASFAAFLEAARTGRTLKGVDGPTRVLLYHLAARTGLRAHKIATLTPASLDLDAPSVAVVAAYAKNRTEAVLPLTADLAEQLRRHCQGRPRTQPLFPGPWWLDAAEPVMADLQAAGLPYVDEDGEVYDFHALRHQFISDLAAAGVHPANAQKLARHSSITLTMDVYTHVRLSNLQSALGRLPPIGQATAPAAKKQA
jgi:integrase